VSWGDYGGLLEELQNYNWSKPAKNEGKDWKKELVGKCFEFPVYAFGYNWSDCASNSGKKLAMRIDEIIKEQKKRGRLCKYVILVTHSMGGLVARSACCMDHEGIGNARDKVLGVIHGVQPAVGAAAGYWRIKAGFERKSLGDAPVAWVLGANGEEVTCILGNAPGGLELLPTRDYTANDGSKQWLHVTLKNGEKISLPNSDPYAEIYRIGDHINSVTNKRDAVFWRLVNPDWLDPTDSGVKRRKTNLGDAWYEYKRCLGKAEVFHNQLRTNSHNRTYQFYSSDLGTADKITFNHEGFYYRKQNVLGAEIAVPSAKAGTKGKCVMYADGNNQEIPAPLQEPHKTFVAGMSRIDDYKGGGDGTVPESSGSALQGKNVLKVSRMKGYAHQTVYKKREARDFVITAVRNLSLKRIEEGKKDGGVGTAK
jgi:pimeloyl-ACP methyl ester carboxylesterase